MPCAQIKAISTIQYMQIPQHIVIIMQWLAHTHQDNVRNVINGNTARNPFRGPRYGPQLAGKEEDLGYNLSRTQMTIKAHLTRCAEGTAISTTRLCRYT